MSHPTMIQYSLQELRLANSDKYRKISPDLASFLAKIHRNKFLHGYLNPYNHYLCPPDQRKKLFPKAEAFSDEKLVEDLRTMLGKVTEKNQLQVKEKIRKIPFTDSSWDLILPMVHHVTIDCVFLIDVLLEIIMVLQELNPKFLKQYQNLLWEQFQNPRVFVANELSLETIEDKQKRWTLSNVQIMFQLYKLDHYDETWIENFLDEILDQITPENLIGIEILNQNWENIRRKLPAKILERTLKQMGEISQDDDFPNRLRFLLMDLIDAS